MDRNVLAGALEQLGQIQDKLEAIYQLDIEANQAVGPRAANDNVSELAVACEAIEDAMNALTRALTNA